MRPPALLLAGLLGGSAPQLAGQMPCPAAALLDSAWTRYRAGAIAAADSAFARALHVCPGDIAATVGLGYTALRAGRLQAAAARFDTALATDSLLIDALVGRGLVAWQRGDPSAARDAMERVRRLEPANTTALELLARLGAEPAAAARPPLILPDTLVYHVRAAGDRFERRTAAGWAPFYLKGINLGAALPGRFPSEFPDSSTYAAWIAEMAAMGANVVRVYTIHPPTFYQALLTHNTAHPARPLHVVHGVWAELPPDDDYRDEGWEAEFLAEMRRVVDLVHGRADVAARPGHAAGAYTADVSPWVAAYLIGREWEPFSVAGFNRLRPADTVWTGRYVRVARGTPMDAWLGRALDAMVAYETETYRTQRPVGYTNWPTLDPMVHPTEATAAEEVAFRTGVGEPDAAATREYDNDVVALDATLLQPTPAFPAGVFAAFHVYPYYPDFLLLDSEYARAESSLGPSSYFGYLRDLKAHHRGVPVLIAEYGIPTSRGISHVHPQGWHHGGHDEAGMAAIGVRLTREIAEAGMAGGILFAWIDEWFKQNWLVAEYELPQDRNRLWLNRLDPEQMYGVVAMEPVPPVSGATVARRRAGWARVPPLYTGPAGTLRAAADAGDLWLSIEPTGRVAELYVGFDVVDSARGEGRWPHPSAPRVPVGLEFVLAIRGDTARLLVDPPYAATPVTSASHAEARPVVVPSIAAPPPGLFHGQWEQQAPRPVAPRANADGRYERLRVVTNRPRFGRDGTEYAGFGYERGVLRAGARPDGDWERTGAAIEVRIPWMLLNVTDPSSRHALGDVEPTRREGDVVLSRIPGIRIVGAVQRRDGRWTSWPDTGAPVALFSWPTWEEPAWRARRRPIFDAIRDTWVRLPSPVGEISR